MKRPENCSTAVFIVLKNTFSCAIPVQFVNDKVLYDFDEYINLKYYKLLLFYYFKTFSFSFHDVFDI